MAKKQAKAAAPKAHAHPSARWLGDVLADRGKVYVGGRVQWHNYLDESAGCGFVLTDAKGNRWAVVVSRMAKVKP
jgi:hypothetical protein